MSVFKRYVIVMVLFVLFILFAGAALWWAKGARGLVTPPEIDEASPVDRVVILKKERRLLLMSGEKIAQEYRISLGPHPEGHKMQEGDGKTPEGIYKISGRNPKSAYHLSLRISYPNEADKKQAAERGVSPGGDIMIHGLPNKMFFLKKWGRALLPKDWTAGCIAVTDEEIEEIWRLVKNGTVVDLRP